MRRPRPLLAALLVLTALTLAAPLPAASAATASRPVTVGILSPLWVAVDGQVAVGVRIQVRRAASVVTAELRVLDADGRVLHLSSKTRRDLDPATYEFSFAMSARDMGLAAGAYTLEARVRSGSSAAVSKTRRLFVVDPAAAHVPVSVIVRVADTPELGPDGLTLADPTEAARTASDTAELARFAIVRPELHLTASVPPFLLDEWARMAAVPPGGETSAAPFAGVAGDTLDSLADAVGHMPLLGAGYGEPDMSAMASAPAEIARQIDAGRTTAVAAITSRDRFGGEFETTGFATVSGLVPAAAASALVTRGVGFVVVGARSVRVSRNATVAAAPYRVAVSGRSGRVRAITALVLDDADSQLLADPAQADALAASLFARAGSKLAKEPVLLEVTIGADGSPAADVERSLDSLSRLPWVRLVDAPAAARGSAAGTATIRPAPADPTPAPEDLQVAIGRARLRTDAYAAAIGAANASDTVRTLMLAESRSWAGSDGSWDLADRALAFALAADDSAWGVLSKVTVEAPSVTLPGNEGAVRVSIVNGSNVPLRVTLVASSKDMRVRGARTTTTLDPGENILSVPVALGSTVTGKLDLAVKAGALSIATTSTAVKASYLDRIVLLAAVVIILVGLLVYIRRRASRGQQGAHTRRHGHSEHGDGR